MLKGREAHKIIPITTIISDKIRTGQVSIGSTPEPIAQREARNSIEIRNIGNSDMYLGTYNVSTTNGYLLRIGESRVFDRSFAEIYGICAANKTTTVCWIEE